MKLLNYTKNVKVPQNCQINPKIIKLNPDFNKLPKLSNNPKIIKNLNWPDLDLTNTVEPSAELHVEDTEAGGRDASEHVLVLDTELKRLLAVFDDVDSEYDGPELLEPVQDISNVLGLVSLT